MDKITQFEGSVFEIENKRNKVEEITIENTHNQYPSAKAVKNALTHYLPLDGDTTFIFNGGDSSSEIDIDLVVDKAPSTESTNPISNNAITNYVNEKFLGLSVDFIVEQAITDNGIYRKWNSGIAECWKKVDVSNISRNEEINGIFYTPQIHLGDFPSDLFVDKPYICDISLQNPEFSSLIETGSRPTTKDIIGNVYLASTVSKESMYATICIYAMGYWK